MTGRAILGLFMTAALLGAPSSASAAGNELHEPAVVETTDGFVPGMLLAGLGTLAGVTLIGTPLLIAVRRRRSPREKDALPTADETTAATLQRRTLRRAKMRLDDDDPILLSMGIGSGEADRAAGQQHRAPGQRPDRTPPG